MTYRTDIYDRYASFFQVDDPRSDPKAADRWRRVYDYYLRNWLPRDKDTPIVDIGCGSGRLLHYLIQRGYTRVSGIDISLEQVQVARQITSEVIQGDLLETLESKPNSYGLVFGFDIVEHFHKDELPRFFRAIRNALAPGGRVVLQTPNADSPFGMHVRYGDLTHEVCFEAGSLTRLLHLYGFGEVECREMGPVPFGYGAKSTLRYFLWRALRQGLRVASLIETGLPGSGVHTRVFLASAVRTE